MCCICNLQINKIMYSAIVIELLRKYFRVEIKFKISQRVKEKAVHPNVRRLTPGYSIDNKRKNQF